MDACMGVSATCLVTSADSDTRKPIFCPMILRFNNNMWFKGHSHGLIKKSKYYEHSLKTYYMIDTPSLKPVIDSEINMTPITT